MMPATASPPQRRRQFNAGYSLVEVLITIVIMALITGLVFQGLGGAARLALRLSDEADRLDRSAMTSDWWRMSVVSALPSAADPEAPETPKKPNLVGTADRLSMETVSSLTARFGAPREVVWSIVKAGSTS
ncbi:MAG TPA: type II secretion system protein, partial [Hyphomonadaceae bacterium]|nr:type II secretion system protein [Hyphomonadaceae bacterium]